MKRKNNSSDEHQISYPQKINAAVAFFEKILLVVILTAMISVSVIQIILRNFFDTGLPSAELVVRHLILWVCFIGASMATYYRSHIKIDIINRLVPVGIKKWIQLFADLFCLVVCVWLGKAGLDFDMDEYEYGGTLTADLPRWIFMVVIPVWFWIMSFRFALRAWDDIKIKGDQ